MSALPPKDEPTEACIIINLPSELEGSVVHQAYASLLSEDFLDFHRDMEALFDGVTIDQMVEMESAVNALRLRHALNEAFMRPAQDITVIDVTNKESQPLERILQSTVIQGDEGLLWLQQSITTVIAHARQAMSEGSRLHFILFTRGKGAILVNVSETKPNPSTYDHRFTRLRLSVPAKL